MKSYGIILADNGSNWYVSGAPDSWYVFKSTEGFWQTQFGYTGTIPLGGTLR